MTEIDRILIECRLLLSLNKNYSELSNILHVNEDIIYDDLNNKLKFFDTKLYNRVYRVLKEKS